MIQESKDAPLERGRGEAVKQDPRRIQLQCRKTIQAVLSWNPAVIEWGNR